VADQRLYTLAEATALLGPLARLIEELRAARAVVGDRELLAALAKRAPTNGGGADGRRFAEAALTMTRGLAQIEAWGVVVRDLDEGLCDFPSEREGRVVYLCWRVGEERIAFWHDVHAGFAGRQPLEAGPAADV
jgi:hypothetical protein